MACIFSLSAECGDKKSAEDLAFYFEYWWKELKNNDNYQVRVDTFQDIENNWWCRVYSDNISCIGLTSPLVKTQGILN